MVRRQASKPVESESNPPVQARKRESLPAPTIEADQFEDVAEYIPATRNVDLSASLLAALRASKESGKGKAGPIESLGGSKEAAEKNIRRHANTLGYGVKVRYPVDRPDVVVFYAVERRTRAKSAEVEESAES